MKENPIHNTQTIEEAITTAINFTLKSDNIKIVEDSIVDNLQQNYAKISFKNDLNDEIILIGNSENINKFLNNNDKNSNISLSILGETLNLITAYISKKLNLLGYKLDITPPEFGIVDKELLQRISDRKQLHISVDDMELFYIIL